MLISSKNLTIKFYNKKLRKNRKNLVIFWKFFSCIILKKQSQTFRYFHLFQGSFDIFQNSERLISKTDTFLIFKKNIFSKIRPSLYKNNILNSSLKKSLWKYLLNFCLSTKNTCLLKKIIFGASEIVINFPIFKETPCILYNSIFAFLVKVLSQIWTPYFIHRIGK